MSLCDGVCSSYHSQGKYGMTETAAVVSHANCFPWLGGGNGSAPSPFGSAETSIWVTTCYFPGPVACLLLDFVSLIVF